jgi:type VI secretion system protein ImpF
MPSVFSKPSIRVSLLERLIDRDPESRKEVPLNAVEQLRDHYQAVCRDLENLLNTRRRVSGWPAEFKELDRSLLSYGLPDFTTVNLASNDGREAFRRMIEGTISRCEPRLKSVTVSLLDDTEPMDGRLHFHIDALLMLDPEPQQVAFDTRLEPATGSFRFEEND